MRPYVAATTPTSTPSAVVRITGRSRSASLRNVPTYGMPLASNSLAVVITPSKPWSQLWLEAVVQASQPMLAIHGAMDLGAAKTG